MNQPPKDRFGALRGRRGLSLFEIVAAVLAAIGVVLLIKWLRNNSFRLWRGQRGFTLIEVVLAVGIIGLIGTGVVKAIDTNARANRVLDEQVIATNLVTSYLENMRQLIYDDSASPYASVGDSVVKPAQYTVAVDIRYSGNGIDWGNTTNLSGTLKLQKISISVFRTSGKLVLTTCTFRVKRPTTLP